MISPQLKSAKPKKSWALGTHKAILFGDLESAGPVQYKHVMTLFDATNQPVLFITSEISLSTQGGSEICFLCIFEGDKHINMGTSNDWADEEKFSNEALRIILQRIGPIAPPVKAEPKKVNKKKLAWGLGIAAIIVIAIVAAPYIKEYFLYRDAVSEKTRYATEEYIRTYYLSSSLNWEHFEEVFYYFLEATKTEEPAEKTIFKAKIFLWKFPNSQFADKVKQLKTTLVDSELTKLADHFKNFPDGKAKTFFNKLRDAFISSDLYFAHIHLKPTINTKDLEEYPSDVVETLSLMTDHPLQENMISLRSNFTESLLSELDAKIKESVQEGFLQVFPTKLFYTILDTYDLTTINSSESWDNIIQMDFSQQYLNELAQAPAVNIAVDYTIANTKYESDGIEYPEIWTYSEDKVFRSYLLGISSDFNFKLELPDSSSSISFTVQSDPSGAINNVSDVGQAYAIMVARTAIKFSDNIKEYVSLTAPDKAVK